MSVKGRIESGLAAVAQLGSGIDWVVGGSTGLMLRGLPLTSEPRDLDLYIDDADFDRLYNLLRPYAVDSPVVSVTDIYRSTLCHFELEGVSVELVGGFVVSAHGCRYETKVSELLKPLAERVIVDGKYFVHTVPLAHELWFNVLRDRPDRYQLIMDAYIQDEARHEEALKQLESHNTFTPEMVKKVHQMIADKRTGVLR
ncbi:hypothetical protein [Paenibacillus radicis (ex Gao et al. 2016)]|uniref:Uncharacterized protein n=1 Tax=Paenibacillus radicis (ex Gao et al. 2016) TaxID=1737354 RepID=A0A917LUE6_9BACL|nr:hypothetical protein [Paenibacillus radicis (ex Gao et al. 2016)]GGG57574.1 hypothetical protein GCM10010918_08270 [Paenibacillus radicis (ex Gao et al. 2016)]